MTSGAQSADDSLAFLSARSYPARTHAARSESPIHAATTTTSKTTITARIYSRCVRERERVTKKRVCVQREEGTGTALYTSIIRREPLHGKNVLKEAG